MFHYKLFQNVFICNILTVMSPVNFRGVDVLNKKSELKKALEKRTEEQKKKEFEELRKSKKTVFQKKLEEQAEKMKPVRILILKH